MRRIVVQSSPPSFLEAREVCFGGGSGLKGGGGVGREVQKSSIGHELG